MRQWASERLQAHSPGDNGGPHARPFFRLLAGLFALAFLLIPWTILRAWWQGASVDTSALGDWAQVVGLSVMALMFGAVAFTGRVPAWLWQLFKRLS